jgi:UDPglucose 6-dehydrogenase
MRISVIGTGYLGATHAACMAEHGHLVVGVDADKEKVTALCEGRLPFFEPGLEELLQTHLASGHLRFSTDMIDAADAEVHFLCVGTPLRPDSMAADLTYLDCAIEELAPLLARPCLVVGKSTVPVGTAQRLAENLTRLSPAGRSVRLAWNPEFLREGLAVNDTLHPDRIVFGVSDGESEAILRSVYSTHIASGVPVIVTSLPTAELVKASANAFLATKISFINAVAELCDATGANVLDLEEALGHDSRIGRRFLHAGLGFGGGCLPKDIRSLITRAGELGVGHAFAFLSEVDAINMQRRQRVVDLSRQLIGESFIGQNVAVLGAAFKPDSDDVRDSPALNVAGQIHLQGAHVTVFDPKAIDNARRLFPTLSYARSTLEACDGADLVLHLTEWPEFRALEPSELAQVTRRQLVLDARNCLDQRRWREAGWIYRGLGQ